MDFDLAITDNGDLFLSNDGSVVDSVDYTSDNIYYDPQWRALVQSIIITCLTLRGEWPGESLGTNIEDFIGVPYTYDVHRAIKADIEKAVAAVVLPNHKFEVLVAPTDANSCNITIKVTSTNTRIFVMQFTFGFVDGLVISGTGMTQYVRQ